MLRSVDEIALSTFQCELDIASEDGVTGDTWPSRGDEQPLPKPLHPMAPTSTPDASCAFSFDFQGSNDVSSIFRGDAPDDALPLFLRRPAPTGTFRSVPPSVQYR